MGWSEIRWSGELCAICGSVLFCWALSEAGRSVRLAVPLSLSSLAVSWRRLAGCHSFDQHIFIKHLLYIRHWENKKERTDLVPEVKKLTIQGKERVKEVKNKQLDFSLQIRKMRKWNANYIFQLLFRSWKFKQLFLAITSCSEYFW